METEKKFLHNIQLKSSRS